MNTGINLVLDVLTCKTAHMHGHVEIRWNGRTPSVVGLLNYFYLCSRT